MIAKEQQAKSFELRAALHFAHFMRDQGRRDEALGLITPIYVWFTEGIETPDLQQAKGLITKLQQAN